MYAVNNVNKQIEMKICCKSKRLEIQQILAFNGATEIIVLSKKPVTNSTPILFSF